ncbi:MAG: hypothetical protein J6L82_05170, partial [Alphaproteobacteria bacterium]|nr:hypothetical protein [Alphaproteobacteria bacterium]
VLIPHLLSDSELLSLKLHRDKIFTPLFLISHTSTLFSIMKQKKKNILLKNNDFIFSDPIRPSSAENDSGEKFRVTGAV